MRKNSRILVCGFLGICLSVEAKPVKLGIYGGKVTAYSTKVEGLYPGLTRPLAAEPWIDVEYFGNEELEKAEDIYRFDVLLFPRNFRPGARLNTPVRQRLNDYVERGFGVMLFFDSCG